MTDLNYMFLNDPQKIKILAKTNELLNINDNSKPLIFVYSAPKVGSTSIVSSLRIFGSNKVSVIHIHDEEMLKVLTYIDNVTINEIVLYNSYLGRVVYVINVYRSPIERKISAFFEKIGCYHFNTEDSIVNNYDVNKVIIRFNNIFPHISLGDHFIDRYNINYPSVFDFSNKYLLVKQNNITYISLRLKDSALWGNILTDIFKFKICVIKDYESVNKPIKNLYNLFKINYRVPINLLDAVMNCKYLNYYYTSEEKINYYNEWQQNSTIVKIPYSLEQYRLYEEISLENCHFDRVQNDHYIDEGCLCKACNLKRSEISLKMLKGINITEKIVHSEAKTELIEKRVMRANTLNRFIHELPNRFKRKDFKNEMLNLMKNKN
jgi:hypothetical protein